MRSYEAARNLFSFLGFCAWAIIALGIAIAFMGAAATSSMSRSASDMQLLLGAAPGIIMAIAGAFGLAMVQMGRTSVDGAEYAQQSLDVSRQQLEISKQILAQSNTAAASYTAVSPARTPSNADTPDSSAASPGATYAHQGNTAAALASSGAAALPDSVGDPQLEKNEQVLLAPAQQEIVYKNGSYFIGENQFQSRKVAVQFQEKWRTADSLE